LAHEPSGKVTLKLAIVGGGRTCKFFLKLIRLGELPFLKIDIIGVCDIDANAEGFQMAQRQGIFTTTDFRDLFHLDGLDGIIELTNNREVLLELIQLRPSRIGIIEHNIGRLLRNLFAVDQKLRSAEQQIIFEKAVRDFLIQQNQQCIVVINTDFTIQAVNDAYLKRTNKQHQKVVGAHCYELIHGLDAPCDSLRNGMVCPMLETLRTGRSAKGIHSVAAGDKVSALHDIVTYPVRNAKGKIVRVIEIWMDIEHEILTRWEKRERELKSDLNKLIQEDRLISLGKLVASCVHEINNPIQGLLTFSHLMKDMLATDRLTDGEVVELRAFSGIMADELERCGKIISGLLSFSRETHIAFRDIDLNAVISSVVDLIRHRIELQDLYFRLDLSRKPLFVHGDTNRLQQCFLNLVFNAIEAMGPGGRLTITLKTKRHAGQRTAVVVIGDTGQGIPKKHLGHIYDPFFTTKPLGEGTGMGLSIVYGVVRNHQGEIKVHSEAGKGTTFTIELPMVTPVPNDKPQPRRN
jgi:two-component system NtrC family sensor kinase